MSARKTVDLFYDVISAYSWFAFETLCRYQTSGAWNFNLRLRPFFLGGIMRGSGNKAPAFVQNKAAYMMKDLQRLSQLFDVPINQPMDFGSRVTGTGSLQAMRLVTAVDMKHPEYVEKLSRELWKRIWNKDQDIKTTDSFKEAARKAGMSDAIINDTLGHIKDQEVKNRLKQTTDEALEYGAFGAPVIIVHLDSGPEHIFGSDRFDVLANILGEQWKGPIPTTSSSNL